MQEIVGAEFSSYSTEDQAFFRFWYAHMKDDLMQPPLANVRHSVARYIWDAAILATTSAVPVGEVKPVACTGLPLVVTSAPERIQLDLGFPLDDGEVHFSNLAGVTWSPAPGATCHGIEYIRADLATPPAPIEGWKLVPVEPTPEHIDSVALRYRHDFGLMESHERDNVRRFARQMYEECIGEGFYKIAAPQPGDKL